VMVVIEMAHKYKVIVPAKPRNACIQDVVHRYIV